MAGLRPLRGPAAIAAVEVGLRARRARWRLLSALGRGAPPPVRGSTTARRWCEAHGARDDGGATWYVDLYPPQPAPALRTRTLDPQTFARLARTAQTRAPGGFVASLLDAWVMTPRGHVVTSDGIWLRDVSEPQPRYTKHVYRRRLAAEGPALPGAALSLVSRYARGNYFHWLMNVLPRAGLAVEAGIAPESVDHLLVNRLAFPYQRETLELLPYQAPAVEIDQRDSVRVERVFVSSDAHLAQLAPWSHRFLRDLLLPAEPRRDAPKRIFVARGPEARRPLVNEEECLDYFERLGFTGVALEQLGVREQAALFSGVTHVVAAHGAGLANLVFCAPGTTVVELVPPELIQPLYGQLAAVAELDHVCAIGTPAKGAGAEKAFTVSIEICERLAGLAGL